MKEPDGFDFHDIGTDKVIAYFPQSRCRPYGLGIVVDKSVSLPIEVSTASSVSTSRLSTFISLLTFVSGVNWCPSNDEMGWMFSSVPTDAVVSCDDVERRSTILQD